MPETLPFRQYDEHDVLNGLFKFSGTLPVTAGTIVTTVGSGWRPDDTDLQLLGAVGANFGNVVSERWGLLPACQVAGTGSSVIGMLLKDVRETDDNGIPLKYFPRRAAELSCVLSGQAVPIVTRGVFLRSGDYSIGSPVAGDRLYPSGNGEITPQVTNQILDGNAGYFGKFLGTPNNDNHALIYLNV